ncbi:hypothetical protein [Sphingobacterium pedocola]|uniref:HTH LytTR-type domain-containing protein n=1 Tax=Sphingobacterium pedocola TaxID=2082722 RepID=A0ABR9TDI9_9SPHI|nr:hypothetical protein [Sphingobacterium pedocola]MBE8722692.1 hypothetical protein [Sphingobacterium pedocola]
MQNLYNRRKAVIFSCRTGVAILAAHIVLSYGEPEGFFEIFGVDGFPIQFFLHLVGFFLLFWATGALLRYKKPRLSQFSSSKSVLALFILKGLVVPTFASILFGWLYFVSHQRAFSLSGYIKLVLPIVIGALLIVLLVEVVLYTLEAAVVIFRAYRIRLLRAQSMQLKIYVQSEEEQKEDLPASTLVKAYRNRTEYELVLNDFYLFDMVGKRVKGYDKSADDYNFEFRALKDVKERLINDPRFFCTSSFIVRYNIIDRVEKGESRTRLIYLHAPFSGNLKLNKTYVKKFLDWYNARPSEIRGDR